MKIFVDDTRWPDMVHPGEDDWTLVRTHDELDQCIDDCMQSGTKIEAVSFDYVLSATDNHYNGRDCAALLCRKYHKTGLEFPKCFIHTTFFGGPAKIEQVLRNWFRRNDCYDQADSKIITIKNKHQ